MVLGLKSLDSELTNNSREMTSEGSDPVPHSRAIASNSVSVAFV